MNFLKESTQKLQNLTNTQSYNIEINNMNKSKYYVKIVKKDK